MLRIDTPYILDSYKIVLENEGTFRDVCKKR